jgi:hypothetical protein
MKHLIALTSCLLHYQAAAAPLPKGRSVMLDSNVGIDSQTSEGTRQLDTGRTLKEGNGKGDANQTNAKRAKTSSVITRDTGSNLPNYYQAKKAAARDLSRVMMVPEKGRIRLRDLQPGDILVGRIDQAIVASPSVPTPIQARVLEEGYLGASFFGEATLDKELKRVLIRFSRYRSKDQKSYSIKAEALEITGEVGLKGDYHEESGKFFLAEMGSATAAGVLDSTINRSQTVNGGFVQEPSLANSAKSGAVAALSRTADRMADRVRQAPEYTSLGQDQRIKIIITEEGALNE